MKRIDIIGRGNVATHLLRMLGAAHDTAQVNPHTLEGLRPDADLYLVSVTDNAIREVCGKLRKRLDGEPFVAHTSGTTGIEALRECRFRRPGVFYPLQTFSKKVELDYSRIPFFTEADAKNDEALLRQIVEGLGAKCYHADSEARRRLHLASVLSCNFVNHLWHLAAGELEKSGLPFEVLRPLIEETTRKLADASPYDAQTGPARRGDTVTTSKHLAMLSDDARLAGIYKLLTDSISKTYECH